MSNECIHIQNAECLSSQWQADGLFDSESVFAFTQAWERARCRDVLTEIPAIFVLWAILRWEMKLGTRVLESIGVDLKSLEEDVRAEIDAVPPVPPNPAVDLFRLTELQRSARGEAVRLQSSHVGFEHLLLALCDSEDEAVRRVFDSHGIDKSSYESAVRAAWRGD